MSSPFTFSERLGILFTIEGALLSLVAVTAVLCFVVYKWLRRTIIIWRNSSVIAPDASDSSLFLNLMLADLIQAIGTMPNIRWMENAGITEGHLCTAQAAIKQVGIVGVAMTSLAISVHTFCILVLRWREPQHMSKLLVLGVWIFVALVIGIPNLIHRNEVYYGANGYWCWIVPKFKTEEIVTEYLWVWISGFVMIILYSIMFVIIRGWFIIDNGVHWHRSYKSKHFNMELETDEDKKTKAIANLMLFYPAVYIICVFPNSLSRWLYFSGHETPYQFTLFASTLFSLSGMWNVILFFSTRPDLVKGPSIVIEHETLPLHQRKESHGGYDSHKLGHLPERKYTDSSPTEVRWTGSNPDSDPSNMGAHHGAYVARSPTAFNGSLGLPSHSRNDSNFSDGRRSRESSSLIEEEDYGHLPA